MIEKPREKGGWGCLEPIPAVTGREAGYTLDRLPVHHRDKRDKQPSTLTLTPWDNLESPINLTCMFLGGRRKPGQPDTTHVVKYPET